MIVLEFFEQGMVCLGRDQMIDHIHSSGKQNFDSGLCGGIGHALGQKALAHSGIANQNDILSVLDKLQVHKVYNSALLIFA